ncbi:MAG TPA: hypothetical protein VKB17_04115 [Thermoleophilaceae bacterium]|nr:hypothetical protein [Thermoleophilaceae bacterium]
MRWHWLALWTAAAVAMVLAVSVTVNAHPERTTVFPSLKKGAVPKLRHHGASRVVCKRDSRRRLRRIYRHHPRSLRKRLRILRRCRYRNIQTAINHARSGFRILIMPGVYKELPSRRVPVGAYHKEPCPNDYVETEGFSNTAPPPAGPRSNDPPVRPDRNYQRKCPNSKNLIAVVGDTRPEPDPDHPITPKCVHLCHLQILGLGRKPTDVRIVGDRRKLDVLRIDRATGIYIRNLSVEQGWFNGIDLVEVSGFRISKVVARYNQNYGILTYTSEHGLYDHIDAYRNGDSGVYPGSNEKGCDYVNPNAYGMCDRGTATDSRAGCGPPTTELRRVNSHDNVLGYSGTAGNSTYIHDSEFHHNSAGLTTDSFASGHPGMPQECFRWEKNRIYSNNNNFFTAERQSYCNGVPFERRPRRIVCPQFQAPVGTGFLIGGGNRNLARNNFIYDNWRWGVVLFWVPGALRGDNDPAHQSDTSNGNQFVGNKMGMRPDGKADPNGLDFWWDGQGARNCWTRNTSKSGTGRHSDPASLPACPGSNLIRPADPLKSGALLPCSAWDPKRNPRPVACDWFDVPPEPR